MTNKNSNLPKDRTLRELIVEADGVREQIRNITKCGGIGASASMLRAKSSLAVIESLIANKRSEIAQ